jgi:sugar phosphate isomerase/epimerase
MKRIPIGLQLYSVREDCTRDLPATLEAVAKMGYQGVEFYNFYSYAAQDLRKMLDDLGLACCGAHTSLASLLGDALPRTIAYNQILGNKYLVVPSLPEERRSSAQAWRATATLFADLAAALKPHGMLTGFHNHAIEFKPVDGTTGFDIFFGATSPDVIMQVDLGNAMHGGGDPIACLRKYPGRSVTIHLKEYSSDNTAMIGEGTVNWKDVFALCEKQGKTDWYIVEQETYPFPPLECAKRCLDSLRAMGK